MKPSLARITQPVPTSLIVEERGWAESRAWAKALRLGHQLDQFTGLSAGLSVCRCRSCGGKVTVEWNGNRMVMVGAPTLYPCPKNLLQ